jgi:hypothetical protein
MARRRGMKNENGNRVCDSRLSKLLLEFIILEFPLKLPY